MLIKDTWLFCSYHTLSEETRLCSCSPSGFTECQIKGRNHIHARQWQSRKPTWPHPLILRDSQLWWNHGIWQTKREKHPAEPKNQDFAVGDMSSTNNHQHEIVKLGCLSSMSQCIQNLVQLCNVLRIQQNLEDADLSEMRLTETMYTKVQAPQTSTPGHLTTQGGGSLG